MAYVIYVYEEEKYDVVGYYDLIEYYNSNNEPYQILYAGNFDECFDFLERL